jgi:hypothetical protein
VTDSRGSLATLHDWVDPIQSLESCRLFCYYQVPSPRADVFCGPFLNMNYEIEAARMLFKGTKVDEKGTNSLHFHTTAAFLAVLKYRNKCRECVVNVAESSHSTVIDWDCENHFTASTSGRL